MLHGSLGVLSPWRMGGAPWQRAFSSSLQHACSTVRCSIPQVPFFFSPPAQFTHDSCSCPAPTLTIHKFMHCRRNFVDKLHATGPGVRQVVGYLHLHSDLPVFLPFRSCHRHRPHLFGLLFAGLCQVGCQNPETSFRITIFILVLGFAFAVD